MQMKLKSGVFRLLCAGILLAAGSATARAEDSTPAQTASATKPAADQTSAGATNATSSSGSNSSKAAARPAQRAPAPRYPAPRQRYRGYRTPYGYAAPRYRAPYGGRYRAPVQGYYRTPPPGYRGQSRYRQSPRAYGPRPGYRNPAARYNRNGGASGPRPTRPRPGGNRPKDKGNVSFGSRPSRPRYRSRPRYDDDDGGLSFNLVDIIPWDDDTRMPWESKKWKGMIPEKFADKFSDKWDKMVNEPSKHKLPGGWYPPSIDAPNPAEVANEFDNAARDFKQNNR